MKIEILVVTIFFHFCSSEEESCPLNSAVNCDTQPERTFIAIKPDAVQRGLVGNIVSRFEQKGFKLLAMKYLKPSQQLLELHYEEHSGRSFFPSLISYMQSGPVVASVWEGTGVVSAARSLLGATNPVTAAPGTIRGDLGLATGRNLCHASDSTQSAEREISLWFSKEEIVLWDSALHNWIHE